MIVHGIVLKIKSWIIVSKSLVTHQRNISFFWGRVCIDVIYHVSMIYKKESFFNQCFDNDAMTVGIYIENLFIQDLIVHLKFYTTGC